MNRSLGFLALWVLAARPLAAAPETPTSPVSAFPEAGELALGNGMRLVLQRDGRQPLVAFVISYEVGWRDDPPGQRGLAELVEELTYQGSRHLAPGQLANEYERVGALGVKSRTTPDHTLFSSLVPAHHLKTPFWLESERMAFTLERFDERGLGAAAHTLARARPASPTHALERALFEEGHPYRPDTAASGTSTMPLASARWLFQAGYRPDNAIAVVVGDFEPSAVEALARRYFAPIGKPPVVLTRRAVPPREFHGRERLVIGGSGEPEALDMVFFLPPPGSSERVAADVLAALLQHRGTTSLEEYLERRTRLADKVEILVTRRDALSWLTVHARLAEGASHATAEAAVERHLASLGLKLLSEKAVAAGREREKRGLISSLEDPLEHAALHLRALRATGRPFELPAYIAEVDRVSAEQLRRVAARYLNPARRLSIWRRNGSGDQDGALEGELAP